jgi:hypothetical protein
MHPDMALCLAHSGDWIKGGASLAIRRVLLASQVALTVMPSPGSLSYQKPHSCYAS